jgi:hypothetical protein
MTTICASVGTVSSVAAKTTVAHAAPNRRYRGAFAALMLTASGTVIANCRPCSADKVCQPQNTRVLAATWLGLCNQFVCG